MPGFLARWRTLMPGGGYPARVRDAEPLDYDVLEEYLRALAYRARLELVDVLRVPRTLPEIRLAPRQVRPGENPDRTIARQTLQEHLDRLADIGVVTSRDATAPGRRGKK